MGHRLLPRWFVAVAAGSIGLIVATWLAAVLLIASQAHAQITPGRAAGPMGGVRSFAAGCAPFTYPGGQVYQSLPLSDSWAAGATTFTTNTTASPGCATDAGTLVENSATSDHTLGKSLSGALSSGAHTLTFWVKRGVGARNIRLLMQNSAFNSGISAYVTLTSSCTISTPSAYGNFGTSPIYTSSLIGGFCKVVMNFNATTSDTAANIAFFMLDGSLANNYAGDGTSSLILWGVDLR